MFVRKKVTNFTDRHYMMFKLIIIRKNLIQGDAMMAAPQIS